MQAQRFVRIAAVVIAAGVIMSLLITFDAAANGTTLTIPYNNLTSGQPIPESSIPMFEIKQAGGGIAGRFEITNTNSAAIALDGVNAGTGHALLAWNYGHGRGATIITSDSTNTLPALDVSSQSLGSASFASAADIRANNASSTAPAARIRHAGQGPVLKLDQAGAAGDIATFDLKGADMARVTREGRGVFESGIRTAAHGLTEKIKPDGAVTSYTRGEVLVVSTSADSRVAKSSSTYSSRVIGVVATEEGVLLTDQCINCSLSPLLSVGILGVFPVKVTAQNGMVHRGDLLATSSTAGAAMRATSFAAGTILGKSLGSFSGPGTGTVPALISLQ